MSRSTGQLMSPSLCGRDVSPLLLPPPSILPKKPFFSGAEPSWFGPPK
jgi:hypothetical protein